MGRVVWLQRVRGRLPYRPRQWLGRESGRQWMILVGPHIFRLTRATKYGLSSSAHAEAAHDGPSLVWEDRGRISTVRKVKLGEVPAGQGAHLVPLESTVFGRLQALVMHCGVLQYDDGSPRRPGWIVIKTLGSSWVVEVKDPDACARLTVVERTLDDALALACVLLESDQAPWEKDQWLAQMASKAKKK